MTDTETAKEDRRVLQAMRVARDNAVASIIKLAEEAERDGVDMPMFIRMLKDFRDMLPPPPEKMT